MKKITKAKIKVASKIVKHKIKRKVKKTKRIINKSLNDKNLIELIGLIKKEAIDYRKRIDEILKSYGGEAITPKIGDKFDNRSMEIVKINHNKNQLDNTVSQVYLSGYRIKKLVILKALVELNQNKISK